MDHLPAGAYRTKIHVRYRAHPLYEYDQKGFLNFPARKGVDKLKLVHDGNHGLSRDDFAAFIQAWLFFGLLSEFMIPPGSISKHQFLWKDYSGQLIITTRALNRLLAEWRCSTVSTSDMMKLSSMVHSAKSVFTPFNNVANVLILDEGESLIIRALGETLEWTLRERQRLNVRANPGWVVDEDSTWGSTHFSQMICQHLGCCSREIFYLGGLLNNSICGLYYATSLSPRMGEMRHQSTSHSNCTISHCSEDDMSNNYRVRHTEACCGCQFLEPNKELIVTPISQYKVPLFKYKEDPDGNPSFEVVPYSKGIQYIVVSHVWADGLGNPHGNAMVACQIKRLAKLVKKFSDFQDQDVYFWIDSICIPFVRTESEKSVRIKAIRMMFDIYSNAFATIVLSADLMDYSAGRTDYLEPAMRIAKSRWMRRLWTFQEGVMSRNLYFLFEDGLKDIEDLELLYSQAASESVVAKAARSFYKNLLRPRTLRREPDVELICSIYRAIQWRSTSHSADETLAIAAILNVSGELLYSVSEEKRMNILLQNLPDIPSGMIFLPGPRLKSKGWRWAPSTWMIGSIPDYPDPLSGLKPSPLPRMYSVASRHSVCTDLGLLVRYPGYRLQRTSHFQPTEADKTFSQFVSWFPTDLSLRQWCSVTIDFTDANMEIFAEVPEREEIDERRRIGIVCCRSLLSVTPETALLVLITGESQGTLHCRWMARVKISLDSGPIDEELGIFRGIGYELSVVGEVLQPDQLWTID